MKRLSLFVLALLVSASLAFGQATTFPRYRLGAGSSSTLTEVSSAGELLVSTSAAAAAATDLTYTTFPRVRIAGGVTGNLAEVDSTGHLLVSIGSTGYWLATQGGTGFASYTIGDLLAADTTTTLSKVAAVALGSVLASAGTGTLPAYTSSPTLTTSLTAPLLIGGTAVGSTLTLKSTTAVGTTDAVIFQVGSNGATEAMRILDSGMVGIGLTAPVVKLQLRDAPLALDNNAAGVFATTKFNSQGVAWSTFGAFPSVILNSDSTVRPEIAFIRGTRTYPEFAIRQHTTADSGGEIYAGPGTSAPVLTVDIKYTGLIVVPTTTQTIAATNTITADACGGLKRITAAGAVATSTTDTFTAPAAANTGCVMMVCNVGATNAITLDHNAHFFSLAGADVVLLANSCVGVASDGTQWRQTTALLTGT